MSGNKVALAVGAAVAPGGVVLVIARLPSRVAREALDPSAMTHSVNSRSTNPDHGPELSVDAHFRHEGR
jgi:hypothetical protein